MTIDGEIQGVDVAGLAGLIHHDPRHVQRMHLGSPASTPLGDGRARGLEDRLGLADDLEVEREQRQMPGSLPRGPVIRLGLHDGSESDDPLETQWIACIKVVQRGVLAILLVADQDVQMLAARRFPRPEDVRLESIEWTNVSIPRGGPWSLSVTLRVTASGQRMSFIAPRATRADLARHDDLAWATIPSRLVAVRHLPPAISRCGRDEDDKAKATIGDVFGIVLGTAWEVS